MVGMFLWNAFDHLKIKFSFGFVFLLFISGFGQIALNLWICKLVNECRKLWNDAKLAICEEIHES